MSELKPALTAEEWGMFLTRGRDPAWKPSLFATEHAHAAMILHGQPFGFTREDVRLLRDLFRQQMVVARAPGSRESHDNCVRIASRIDDLADRIEALLPPEGE